MSEHEEIIFNLFKMYFFLTEHLESDFKVTQISYKNYSFNLKHSTHKIANAVFPENEVCDSWLQFNRIRE
jgi:hypothetical protein